MGKSNAPRTIYLEVTTIKSVVKHLIHLKRLPESSRLEVSVERPQDSDTYCYSINEVRAIIDRCNGCADLKWLTPLLHLLALTGMRIGEAASLDWSDIKLNQQGTPEFIDLTDNRSRAKSRQRGEVRRIKGRRGCVIPVHSRLAEVLQSMPRNPDGRVFHGPLGGRLKPDTVRNILVRSVIQPSSVQFRTQPGQVGFADARLHSFRHFFFSQAFLEGATESEIKQWVGHRDSRVVELYRHLSDAESHRRIQKLNLLV